MAKQTCAICGAEINLIQQQKLADGSYICRKNCKSVGMKQFDYVHADLPSVLAHHDQVNKGTKIFNQYFVPRMKTKQVERFGDVYVAPDIGLMALAKTDYKFFIFGKYYPKAVVYRIADLKDYDEEMIETKTSDGKIQKDNVMRFFFANTAGLYTFTTKVGNTKSDEACVKYFNKLFGIQKTIGNMGNTWKNQISAIGAMGKAIGEAVKSGGEATENVVSAAGDAADMLNVAIYGDRSALIAAADQTLAEFEAQG